jgi:hypothetical protein
VPSDVGHEGDKRVKYAQGLGLRPGRQRERDVLGARVRVGGQELGSGWHRGHNHWQARRGLGQPIQLRLDPTRVARRMGHPAIAVRRCPGQRGVPIAADVDGRMRLLYRLGPGENRVEVNMLAVELGLVLGPDLLERDQLFVRDRSAGPWIRAVVAHFFTAPACAHPEDHPAAGYQVQAGDLLGRVDHIPLDQQGHPSPQQQVTGDRCCRRQRDEWVERTVIHPWQLAARGKRRHLPHWNVAVLVQEE